MAYWVICCSAKVFEIADSITGVRKSCACDEMGWAIKSNDLLVGKGSSEKKFQIADSVTIVRESYTCYEICEARKLNDVMNGWQGSLNQKSQTAESVTGVHKTHTCCVMGWAVKCNDLLVGKGTLLFWVDSFSMLIVGSDFNCLLVCLDVTKLP